MNVGRLDTLMVYPTEGGFPGRVENDREMR